MDNKKSLVYSCKTGESCQFSQELEALKEQVKYLSSLVNSDTLTGLFNYRHFCQALEQEIERSQRTHQPTTLLMIDVDFFKKVNDQWGHDTGNLALQFIAKNLNDSVRKLDIICRYGGEEFAVILPSSDSQAGARIAERIRKTIAQTPLQLNQSENHLSLTVSIGISSYKGENHKNSQTLIKEADEQLYKAKKQGRNQVCYEMPERYEVSADEKSLLLSPTPEVPEDEDN